MKFISRTEELLLLSVWKLKGDAYAVTIRDELKALSGKEWAFGALFVSLERLVKKELLRSHLADPTPERGGKAKRIYELTGDGKKALKEVRQLHETIWNGIEGLSTK